MVAEAAFGAFGAGDRARADLEFLGEPPQGGGAAEGRILHREGLGHTARKQAPLQHVQLGKASRVGVEAGEGHHAVRLAWSRYRFGILFWVGHYILGVLGIVFTISVAINASELLLQRANHSITIGDNGNLLRTTADPSER